MLCDEIYLCVDIYLVQGSSSQTVYELIDEIL